VETWRRERSWTIEVPVETGAITFTTDELLAQRTTRLNYQREVKWTPGEGNLDPRERFVRALAKTLCWSAPSDDRGREELVREIEG
jgi:hypothetical protein